MLREFFCAYAWRTRAFAYLGALVFLGHQAFRAYLKYAINEWYGRFYDTLQQSVEFSSGTADDEWRAAQRARLHEIPALVRDLDQREVMALALIENLQREDLNPVEEARAYQKLSEDDGMTQAEIAKLVDKSRSHVANFQRLLALPDTVLALVADGALSMGHARALIGREEASELAQKAVSEGLSVRQMEALTRKPRTRQPSSLAGTTHGDAGDDADIVAVQGHLEEFLGMPVKITTDTTPNSGAVTIRFRTLDQLDLICQRLTGGDI